MQFFLTFLLFSQFSLAEISDTKELSDKATPVETKQVEKTTSPSKAPVADTSVAELSIIGDSVVDTPTVEETAVDTRTPEENLQAEGEDLTSHSQAFTGSVVEIGFEYPLNFGTHLKYYIYPNFYTRLGAGFMAFFLGSFAKIAPILRYLNPDETSVISSVFQNSFYTDLRFGWFPYNSNEGGPYVELGLSGMFFGKGKVSGFTLSKSLELEDLDNTEYYSLKTNSYNGTVHVGYQIPLENLKLNIEVGLVKILHTELRPVGPSIDAPNQLDKTQTKVFQNFLKNKGWIFPTVSGWIGFSF